MGEIPKYFYQYYKPELIRVSRLVKNGQAVIFVGINGIGKNLLAGQILSNRFRKEFLGQIKTHLVFLDFKDKAAPSREQLLQYWLSQTAQALKIKAEKLKPLNEFTFYSQMERLIRTVAAEEKICFLVLDAQQILSQSEQFFDCLINLKYYSYGKISYVFLAEPRILAHPNAGLQRFIQRLTNNKFSFLRTFDQKTSLADIRREEKLFQTSFGGQERMILEHSHGLHGLIRAFSVFLRKNPQVKDIRQLKKILFASQLYCFWIREILESLPAESLRILKAVSQNRSEIKRFKKSLYLQWLFDLGLLKKDGQLKQPLFLPVLEKMTVSTKSHQPLIKLAVDQFSFSGEKVKLTQKEFLVLRTLYKNRGKVVSFERIGNVLWSNKPDNFSLWAISQVIRRLRKKLNYYFINPKTISSLRGEGYSLEVK
ncbi:MAG TPA: helix-turn-helix domain-containing protein [Candidatus Bathyarchaeia archaeon]|nr:helix-turn-helix domain-containing protein [Candidatus Bathyarchaeia archaeon]